MDFITETRKAIMQRAAETKNPCRMYKSKDKADSVAQEMSAKAAKHFGADTVRYTVIYLPEFNKYTSIFDITLIIARGHGGNISFLAEKGFFCY